MAHVWSNALSGAWYNGYLATGTNLSALDGFITVLINGDGGGTWTPSSVITIGGAGVNILGPWTLHGTAVADGNVAAPFEFGDSDFFVLATGHSLSARVILVQCESGLPTAAASYFAAAPAGPGEPTVTWVLTETFETPLGFGTYVVSGSNLIQRPMPLVVPIRVHNGATIIQTVLQWAVGQAHSGVPENLPKWRVVSISAVGQVTPLNSSYTGNYDNNGYLLMVPPASGSAYYNSGTPYNHTYACDGDVVIDTALYEYAVEIIDEWGVSKSLVGNLYMNLNTSFADIPSMAFQT
jgi:hypothetical protein